MPTTREFLGDSLIKELEGAGFSPQSINAFAKNEYRQRKAAQEEEQRRLLYRADDMKLDGKTKEALLSGDINEQEAKNAQKFEEFGSKKHGFALGAAKTVAGIANTVERVGDFINPFYEGKRNQDGNYIYQNGLEKSLRSKIKNVEKMRDDYEKATGETSWGSRLSEIGTEMVGDPINFVGGVGLLSKGSKLAQFGKKTLYFAGTGAASGGVAALGEGKNDEETLKNIGYGAAGGAFLGHAIDQGIQGISKLIAKRQASKMANEADAIDSAQNSEFLGGERAPINTSEITARKDGPLLHAERSQRDYATKGSPAQIMTAREFATKEVGLDEDTATNVLKEAMQGKEKSEFIDADSYNDIVKFKNFEVQREYAKAYGEKIQTAQTSINNAREQSAIRYADTQKAINEYQKQGMSASATRELINAKFKPSADEINYTRAYNDGADVDARLAGQGIFYALEKDIAAQAYTPEIYATRLKQRGFSDESVQAFTQAYASKDIDIAKEYVNEKVADAYESRVQREVADEINSENRISINKNGAYRQHPMLRPDEPSIGQGSLKGNLINETTKQEDLSSLRAKIEQENNIVPIKEFGTNYAEFYHDGKGAIDKLLTEREGQVAGAFYRKELGDIDLVWGNENFGLAHILKRRSEQWGEEKAIKFLSHLDENIKNGDISQAQNKRVAIKTNKTTIILDNMGENKFVLSAYRDRSNAKSENAKFVQSSDIISKDVEANAKDSSVLLPTDDHIISKSGETSSVSSDAFTKGDNLPLTAEVKGDVANLSAYSDEFKGELTSSHPPLSNENIIPQIGRETDTFTDPSFKVASDNLATNSNKNIISQKGNLINEEAKNSALPNGVSSIGDNASRARGRQGGDEEILRQSGRNTADASEEKWTAKSDRQMEQRPAFKRDGDTDATAASKQMVEKQGRDDNEIRGENFITKQSPAPKSDLNIKMDLAPNIRDLSKITTEEISADLDYLASKHPEMFSKPSDVFRLIREIKNEPTHFFNNNRLDYALIVKRMDENKIGKLAIDKESGEVKHATKVKERDLKRLDKVSRENSKDAGIIQTFIQPGSKSNSELGLPNEIIPKQTQEEYKQKVSEIRGDGFVVKNGGKLTFMDEAKFELSKELQGKTDLNEKISTSLAWLHSKHPEMFENKRAVKELIDYVLDEPNTIKAGKSENSVYLGKKDDTKIKDIVVDKDSNKIIHANSRKMNASEKKERASEDALHSHTDTKPAGALKLEQDARLARNSEIIPQKDKNTKTINANSHIASGLVGGTLNSIDEDGNFNPEKFAAGFLAGLAGSKAVAIAARKMTPELYNKILGVANKMPQMAKDNPKLLGKLYANGKDVSLNSFAGEKAITANVGKLDQAKAMLENGADEVEIWQKTGWFKDKDEAWKFEIGDSKARLNPNFKSGGRLGELLEHEELFKAYPELKDISLKKIGDDIPEGAALSVKDTAQKEKRGIYNVTYNDKTATLVRQDLKNIDDALMFEKGSSKKGGAIHIKKHLEPEAQGAITQSELLNIGKNIREYLKKYKEPFIDEHGGRIYEWANKEGVKFRVVVYEKTDGISASHPETIISFYSNRNLKKPMEFRNPEVKYDVNLRQWHKDSSAITKNADGSPKVFYHGSKAKDITEFKDEFDKTGVGFWFSPNKNTADEYGDTLSVYLKAKKIMDFAEPTKKDMEVLKLIQEKMFWSGHIKLRETNNEPLFRVMLDIFRKNGVELKQLLKERGYDGIRVNKDMFVVFDSAQIKHVKNNGNFSDSPNIYKSGKEGYYSPANNEIGLSYLGDKSTLMHEVQHAIQEIEGFAKGSGKKGESYRLSHGEVEARNVQNRLNLDDKVYPHETFDVNPDETFVSREGGVSFSVKDALQKERRGVYNVAFNEKKSTIIRKDLDAIDEIIKFEKGEADYVINGERKSGYGALHIKKHLDTQNNGWVSKQEYLDMGQMLRKSTMQEADDKRIYTYFNDDGVRFRVVVGTGKNKERIISFYSNRKPLKAGLSYDSQNYNGNLPLNGDKVGIDNDSLTYNYADSVQGSVAKPVEHSLDNNVRSSGDIKSLEHSSDGKDIIQQNEEKIYHSRKIEEIKQEHPNVEKELDESIAAMRKESFNDVNFKDNLISKINAKDITTKQLGKSVDLSDKQLAVLKNDIKNADFKVISDSKIYFDKMGRDGDKKRFFIDIAEDGKVRVDGYSKKGIDTIPVRQSALEELAGVGDRARLKNMSFEVKAAYFNELDPIKKEAILKTAEYNALKKEMRGIYNVINNGKESTNVYKELQKIDEAIKLDLGSNKKGGGVHIQKHLDPDAKGAVSQQEVMNMGENMREYLKKYKEPFRDKDGGKIYEWQDKDGVRFRVAVYDKFKKSAGAGSTTRITTTDARENIITFYSDRNINARMEFLNPKVRVEAKFEEFKARNLDENGNIKDGLSLC